MVYGWNMMTRITEIVSLKRSCLQLDKVKSQNTEIGMKVVRHG